MTAAAAVQVEASPYAWYRPRDYLRAFLRSGGRVEVRGERMRELGLGCSANTLDRYRKRLARTEPLDQRPGHSGAKPSAVFDEAVFEQCVSLALHGNKLPVGGAYGIYACGKAEAARRGVPWTGKRDAFAARLEAAAPGAFRTYGRSAWEHEAYCLPKLRRPRDLYGAGECLSLDGRTDDRFCSVPKAGGGLRLMRATIHAVFDFRSNYATVHIGRSETGRGTLVLLKKVFRRCVAKRVETDRGWGFGQAVGRPRKPKPAEVQQLKRALEYFGVEVSLKPPRYAWRKPAESLFARLKELARLDPYFCGGDHDERPEDVEPRARANLARVTTFEEVCAQIARDVAVYNNTPQDALTGKTPREVYEANVQRVRPADPELLDFLFTVPAGTRKVGRDGVQFNNLLYGWGDEAVYRLQGETVHLRIDPEDPSYIWLCDKTGKPLHIAACSDVVGATHEQIKAAEQKRGRLRKLAREFAAAHDQLTGDKVADVRRVIYEDRRAEAERRRKAQAPAEPPPATVRVVAPELAEAVHDVVRNAERTSLRRRAAQPGGERPFQTLARNVGQGGATEEGERVSFADVREVEQEKSNRAADKAREHFRGLREVDATDGTSAEPKTTFAGYGEGSAAAG